MKSGLLPRVMVALGVVALVPLLLVSLSLVRLNREAMTTQVLRTHAVAARATAARLAAGLDALTAAAAGAREGRGKMTKARILIVDDDEALLAVAAWLEDELERRRRYLPAPDTVLSVAGDAPEVPRGLEGANTAELAAWLRTRGTATMAAAEAAELAAPDRIRLAVAWLVERGILKVSGVVAGPEAPLLRSSELDPYLARSAVVAAGAGLSPEVVHVLVVTAANRWPRLAQLVREHYGAGMTGASAGPLSGARRDSEVLRLDYEDGTVLVHVNVLTGISGLRAKAALPLSSVVIVCAGETVDDDDVASFLQAAAEAPENARRLLLLEPGCTETVEIPGWSVRREVPGSLSDLLRIGVGRDGIEESTDGRAAVDQ